MRKDDVATIAGNPGREATACTRLDMKATLRRTRSPAKVALVVKSIGYLVPQSHFDGVVQSVYARACNISCGDSLLAVVAPDVADGPTTLLLDNHFAVDLRTCFRIGDAVARRGGRLTSREADVDLSRATAWRPHKRHVVAQDLQVLANLRITGARLAVRLQRHTSVVHREVVPSARVSSMRVEPAISRWRCFKQFD